MTSLPLLQASWLRRYVFGFLFTTLVVAAAVAAPVIDLMTWPGVVLAARDAGRIAEIQFPKKDGKYRLLVHAHDGHGNATSAPPLWQRPH